MAEEWRDIEGYEGHYQVSNAGRVRSLDRTLTNRNGITRQVKGKILRGTESTAGYVLVLLCLNADQRFYSVHRLVAKAFIPTDDESLVIDHINGIPYDNRVENLRWVTQKENIANRERLRGVPRDRVFKPAPHEKAPDLPGEEWRAVVGFEGLYEVSNCGRVRSLDRVLINKNGVKRNYPGKILSPTTLQTGYYEVQLSRDNKVLFKRVHQLVAGAFLESDPNPERNFIDHINGIKTDNRPENLRWATPKENWEYAVDLGLIDVEQRRETSRKTARKQNLGMIHAKPVIRSDGKRYKSASEAARDIGCHHETVQRVARGERKSCHGFGFKYAEKAS